MSDAINELEVRGMQHFGNILALEAIVTCLIATHPEKEKLHAAFSALRPQLDSFLEKSIMLLDDVSPNTAEAMQQYRKLMSKFETNLRNP